MAHHFPALKTVAGLRPALLLTLVMTGACSDPAPEDSLILSAEAATEPAQRAPVDTVPQTLNVLTVTQATCDLTVAGFATASTQLADAGSTLTGAPSPAHLATAQSAWRQATSAWGAALPCLALPLVESAGRSHASRLARTAAGPAMAGFVDAIPGYDRSGLIHDQTVDLTMESLLQQHQLTDDGEVALGLYALEVLLFGVNGRESADFAGLPATAAPNIGPARRSAMSRLVASDLAQQGLAWNTYWHTSNRPLSPASASVDAAAERLATVLASWQSAARTLQNTMAQHEAGRPALALYARHDRLLLQGFQRTLASWWQAPEVLGLARAQGLDGSRWQAVGDMLAQPVTPADTLDWATAGERLDSTQQQLNFLLATLPEPS